MDYNALGKRVREARGDMSLRDFAQKCDISHTHIDSIEKGIDPRTGKQVSVRWETLEKISNATGLSVYYLTGDTDYVNTLYYDKICNRIAELKKERDNESDKKKRDFITQHIRCLQLELPDNEIMKRFADEDEQNAIFAAIDDYGVFEPEKSPIFTRGDEIEIANKIVRIDGVGLRLLSSQIDPILAAHPREGFGEKKTTA